MFACNQTPSSRHASLRIEYISGVVWLLNSQTQTIAIGDWGSVLNEAICCALVDGMAGAKRSSNGELKVAGPIGCHFQLNDIDFLCGQIVSITDSARRALDFCAVAQRVKYASTYNVLR